MISESLPDLREYRLDRPVELDAVLLRIMDQVTRRLSADRCTLYLVDHARNELVSRVGILPELAEIRLRIGEGVAGQVAATGAGIRVSASEGGAPVFLIDELDRTDEPFEAFLLEALSDFQVTIPELGTIRAPEPPIVILTSNRTREVHDALKRRCLYHWVDYPSFDREMEILHARAPEATETLSREIVAFVQKLRREDLFKKPGVAETIDWAKCLLALDVIALSPEVIADTLGAILKYQDDIQKIAGAPARKILDELRADFAPA